MKFMKLGTRPDTFYTEEATRTVVSDGPSDLIIQINNINYLLHKEKLLPSCGLLQQLCSDSTDSGSISLDLHNIPGQEEAFELCAKFCYGITINLGAHNIVLALCAAKFLQMTEAVEKGNFVLKLDAFFNSCILEGWKDSILALQTTRKVPEWSEDLGIIRRCIDSIVDKILTTPSKVTWSYTYTRPGYSQKRHQFAPKDWWTEDVSDLDVDMFKIIISAVRSANVLPPQLIGEALHVYACRWLLDTTKSQPQETSASHTQDADKKQQILETIVNLIPADSESVSIGFLLRLHSVANNLGASPVTKTGLIRRCSLQIEEATVNDLLLPTHLSSDRHLYDVDLVGAVLESFLLQRRRRHPVEHGQAVRLIQKVGKLIDAYLQVVAKDVNMPVSKIVSLAAALPEIARPDHDDLYKAINTYLKEHPDLEKKHRKCLCSILDCQKLSPQVRAHAMRNERLPLRTVVQVLFFEQERSMRSKTPEHPPQGPPVGRFTAGDLSKLNVSSTNEQSHKIEANTRPTVRGIAERSHHRTERSDRKLLEHPEESVMRKEVRQTERDRGRAMMREEGPSGCKVIQRRSR